eukprot:3120861-Alexandrium_andersonii.AAC.1
MPSPDCARLGSEPRQRADRSSRGPGIRRQQLETPIFSTQPWGAPREAWFPKGWAPRAGVSNL